MSFKKFYLGTAGIFGTFITINNLNNNDITRVYLKNKKPILDYSQTVGKPFVSIYADLLRGIGGAFCKGIFYGTTFPIALPAVLYDMNNTESRHYRHLYFDSSRGLDASRLDVYGIDVQSNLNNYFNSK